MEKGRNGQNHRKSARSQAAFTLNYSIEKPFELRISLGLPDETGALMQDLSDLGAAIITSYDIPPGTLLRIKFNLMNLRLFGEKRLRRMELIAEVMSNSVMPDESHRIGIRFDKISEEDKAAIRDFVERDKK
ncbi:MAG: PilZ domain-containing protein [Candidatus Omnitrophica bacterium]|nr:PilZ domain-containing protein [Candidatus Omnitrophota bacterium]